MWRGRHQAPQPEKTLESHRLQTRLIIPHLQNISFDPLVGVSYCWITIMGTFFKDSRTGGERERGASCQLERCTDLLGGGTENTQKQLKRFNQTS